MLAELFCGNCVCYKEQIQWKTLQASKTSQTHSQQCRKNMTSRAGTEDTDGSLSVQHPHNLGSVQPFCSNCKHKQERVLKMSLEVTTISSFLLEIGEVTSKSNAWAVLLVRRAKPHPIQRRGSRGLQKWSSLRSNG